MPVELTELKIGETVYKVQKLSGYRLLKTVGREDKDPADMYRDLILACIKKPKLTKKDVEEMDAAEFLRLGVELLGIHRGDLQDFRELMNLAMK
jgi:hypothetical protein